jgi:hypothetical protein
MSELERLHGFLIGVGDATGDHPGDIDREALVCGGSNPGHDWIGSGALSSGAAANTAMDS